jgi:aspartate--ammonia ligase
MNDAIDIRVLRKPAEELPANAQLVASKLILPRPYANPFAPLEVEEGIKFIKDHFEVELARALNLRRVTAPLFLPLGTGINDTLNGVERPVSFTVPDAQEARAEIVQSLAKWKRLALARFGLHPGEGLYTDMNAIRPDEVLDNLHSIYVDQWDWERVITAEERKLEFLRQIVGQIYDAIRRVEQEVADRYTWIRPILPEQIHFVHTEELEERYPSLSRKQREDAIAHEMGSVFLIGIGASLRDGLPHDGRAPDYDDWFTPTGEGRRGLNGDLIVWNPVLGMAFELSSMGIRVDRNSLLAQLEIRERTQDVQLPFHRALLEDRLPLSIGGGIGQSRLCMYYLRRAHIGEVQASLWPGWVMEACRANGISLLQ